MAQNNYNTFMNQSIIDASTSSLGKSFDGALFGAPEGFTKVNANLYYSYSPYQKLLDETRQTQNSLAAQRTNAELNYRDQVAQYNAQRSALNLDISNTQNLLSQLQDSFGIDRQLLARQQQKQFGQSIANYNAAGFGSGGMADAIARDLEAQQRLENARMQADQGLQTTQYQNKISASENQLKNLIAPHRQAIASQVTPNYSTWSPLTSEQEARQSGVAWGWEGTNLLRGGFTF